MYTKLEPQLKMMILISFKMWVIKAIYAKYNKRQVDEGKMLLREYY